MALSKRHRTNKNKKFRGKKSSKLRRNRMRKTRKYGGAHALGAPHRVSRSVAAQQGKSRLMQPSAASSGTTKPVRPPQISLTEQAEQARAASAIQKLQRGRQSRKSTQQTSDQDAAATKMQSILRGIRTRKQQLGNPTTASKGPAGRPAGRPAVKAVKAVKAAAAIGPAFKAAAQSCADMKQFCQDTCGSNNNELQQWQQAFREYQTQSQRSSGGKSKRKSKKR